MASPVCRSVSRPPLIAALAMRSAIGPACSASGYCDVMLHLVLHCSA